MIPKDKKIKIAEIMFEYYNSDKKLRKSDYKEITKTYNGVTIGKIRKLVKDLLEISKPYIQDKTIQNKFCLSIFSVVV